MPALDSCCCCLDLELGVQLLAILGLLFNVLYLILSLIIGRRLFLLPSLFHPSYLYFGIVFVAISIFVHALLWSGAREKHRFKFLPWLVFIMLKCALLIAMIVNLSQHLASPGDLGFSCVELCKNVTNDVESMEQFNGEQITTCLSFDCLDDTSLGDPLGEDMHAKILAECEANPTLEAGGEFNCWNQEKEERFGPRIGYVVVAAILLVLHLYFWIVVYSLYEKINPNISARLGTRGLE